MPKPINKDRGRCPCRVKGCNELASVRRMKDHDRGALYLVCPVHGVDRTSGKHQKALDEWIEANMIPPDADPEPGREEPATEPAPELEQPAAAAAPETQPNPEPDPAPADPPPAQKPRRGFFAEALQEFRGWME